MALRGTDLTVKVEGWYQNNSRIGQMKEHNVYRKFKAEDIIWSPK